MSGEELLLALGCAEGRLVEEALDVPKPFAARLTGRKWGMIAAAAAFALVFCGVLAVVRSQPRRMDTVRIGAETASTVAGAQQNAGTTSAAYPAVGGSSYGADGTPSAVSDASAAGVPVQPSAQTPSASATAAATVALPETGAPEKTQTVPVLSAPASAADDNKTAAPTAAPTVPPASTEAANGDGGSLLSGLFSGFSLPSLGGYLQSWLGSLSGAGTSADNYPKANTPDDSAQAPPPGASVSSTAAPAALDPRVSPPELYLTAARQADGTFAVTAGVKNAAALTSVDLSLSYDAAKLELVSFSEEENGMQQTAANRDRNPILFGGYYDTPLTAERVPFFTAVFRLREGAGQTELLITARGCHVQDPDRPVYTRSVTEAVEARRCTIGP